MKIDEIISQLLDKSPELLTSIIKLLESEDSCDNVCMDEVLNKLAMKKKIKEVKLLHPYPINYTEKSKFFTVVDDESRPDGKRKMRRSTEEGLWELLAEWYLEQNKKESVCLTDLFTEWIIWNETPTNGDNIKRIRASWKTYYLEEPLSQNLLQTPLNKLTSLMLREWAESLLKKYYPVDKKKFSRIFMILNQCLEYASDEDRAIVSENLWEKVKKKINPDLLSQKVTPQDEEQVFTDEERLMLREEVESDLIRYKKQSSSAGLQILFMLETGLRIGEATGLKFSDIKENRLYIRRQANNEGVKDWTKTNAGYRDIPLTKEARRILKMVQQFNKEHGFDKEWIFQSNNADYDFRLSYNATDRKLRKLCKRIGTVPKSPHKLRKTCISTLLDSSEVNDRTVQRFAGHKDLSTTHNYYNFDRKSKEEQAEAIDRALSL